jgi:hypothetical protein
MRSHTVGTAFLVDLHHFDDADPDPRHSIVMPIRIQIGIRTMTIRKRILTQVLHVLKNKGIFLLLFPAMQVYNVFLISGICVMILRIFM